MLVINPRTGTRHIHGVSEESAHRRVSTNQARVVAAAAMGPREGRTGCEAPCPVDGRDAFDSGGDGQDKSFEQEVGSTGDHDVDIAQVADHERSGGDSRRGHERVHVSLPATTGDRNHEEAPDADSEREAGSNRDLLSVPPPSPAGGPGAAARSPGRPQCLSPGERSRQTSPERQTDVDQPSPRRCPSSGQSAAAVGGAHRPRARARPYKSTPGTRQATEAGHHANPPAHQ